MAGTTGACCGDRCAPGEKEVRGMKTWMRCTLYPGQFPTELAVVLRSHAGRVLSLFASKTSLRYDQEPSRDAPMEGWVQVEIVKNEKNLYLVRLPQTTLENGQY